MFGLRLKRPALLPACMRYDTRPFSPSSSSRAITYKMTNLPTRRRRETQTSKHFTASLEHLLSEETVHSPHGLILHHADGRRRAEHRGVVVLVRHEDPGGDRTPAPLGRVQRLVGGPHHQVEGGRGLTIQLLAQGQHSAGGVQRQEALCVGPVVLDGVEQLTVWSTAIL